MIAGLGQYGRWGLLIRAALIAALALVGGAVLAYSPMLAFFGAAAVFMLGLWMITADNRPLVIKTSGQEESPEESARDTPRRTLADRLIPVYLLLVWIYMIAPIAVLGEREVGGTAAAQAVTSGGSFDKQILVLSYGLVGLLFIPSAIKRLDTTFRWLLVLWILYLGWAYTSLFWSVAPDMTIRRLVAFTLVSVGSIGLGAGFYGNRPDGRERFLRHIIVASVLSALFLLVPLTLNGALAGILDPSYRVIVSGDFYSFVVRPAVVALMVMAAASMLGLRRWHSTDLLVVPILLLALFALKTRGPILYALIAFAIVYVLYRFRVHERIFQAGIAVTTALGLYTAYSGGLLKALAPYLTRDDPELTMSLTGRIPLWEALLPEVAERPLAGSGFAAFWNPQRLYEMEALAGFPVVSAHNGFLEELLSTGIIGLFLFLVFWIAGMIVSLKRVREGDRFGWLLFIIMLYYLVHNVTTSLVHSYLEIPFIMVFALLGLLACGPPRAANPDDAQDSSGAESDALPIDSRV